MIAQPNYTQCPNIFFDEILKELSGSETKVFCVIMRKTYGWQKERDRISYSQIMEMSGIVSKATVSEAIKSLELKGYIIAEKEKQTTVYSVNITEIEPVQKLNRYDNCTDNGSNIEPVNAKTGTKTVHTKENNINKLSKENINKEIFNTYISAYKELFGKEPIIMYANISKMVKKLLQEVTKEQIISAINFAKTDNFCSKITPFELSTILSDKVISRLINSASYSKTPIPEKRIPREAKKCPKCGGDIRGSACVVCYTNFDYEGNEI